MLPLDRLIVSPVGAFAIGALLSLLIINLPRGDDLGVPPSSLQPLPVSPFDPGPANVREAPGAPIDSVTDTVLSPTTSPPPDTVQSPVDSLPSAPVIPITGSYGLSEPSRFATVRVRQLEDETTSFELRVEGDQDANGRPLASPERR